ITESVGAQLDLQRRFLTGYVQHFVFASLQRCRDLKQQRGFSDAGLASNEHDGSRDDATAEYEIEFTDSRFPSPSLRAVHVAEPGSGDGGTASGQRRGPAAAARSRTGRIRGCGHDLLDKSVPVAADVAAAGPLGMIGSAIGASVDRSRLWTH